MLRCWGREQPHLAPGMVCLCTGGRKAVGRGAQACQPDPGGLPSYGLRGSGLILQAPGSPSARAYALPSDIISFAFGEDQGAPLFLSSSRQQYQLDAGVCL